MFARLRGSMSRHSLPWFFALAFLFTWAQWIPLALAGRVVSVGPEPSHFPGLFGPLVAAFVVAQMTVGRTGVTCLLRRMFRWRVAPRWYLAALSPLAWGAIAWLALRASGQPLPDPADFGRMGGIASLPPALMFLALIPLNGFSEEVGWRGFALPRLQSRHGVLAASALLAVPWAIWHLPSFFVLESYRGMSPVMLPAFFLGLLCGSLVLGWLYSASGSSLLMVAIYHGALNLMSATLAARGPVAAFVSTGVMLHAAVLVALEWRSRRRARVPGWPRAVRQR